MYYAPVITGAGACSSNPRQFYTSTTVEVFGYIPNLSGALFPFI
jgi:hypothetical protein